MAEGSQPGAERLPSDRLFALGIQHVLVAFASAAAPAAILGSAFDLPPDRTATLVAGALFVAGVATLLQSIGVTRYVGLRMPVVSGLAIAGLAPVIAHSAQAGIGLPALFGASLVAGFVGIALAPLIAWLAALIPPVVSGSMALTAGLAALPAAIQWAAGAAVPTAPGYGTPAHLIVALIVLAAAAAILRWGKWFMPRIAVLLALVLGYAVAAAWGQVSPAAAGGAAWFAVPAPLAFGRPAFDLGTTITVCLAMLAAQIEAVALFYVFEVAGGRKLARVEIAGGLFANGLASLVAGLFNACPVAPLAQNAGLAAVSGPRSRWAGAIAGAILVLLAFLPKVGAVVATLPPFVLGGACLVLFGLVAVGGLRILAAADLAGSAGNAAIVAASVGIGLIPTFAPSFFDRVPVELAPLYRSGVFLAFAAALLLNLAFNGRMRRAG